MPKVSKKCPSAIFLHLGKPSIYEGAGSRIRTDDLLITKRQLCQVGDTEDALVTLVNYLSDRVTVGGATVTSRGDFSLVFAVRHSSQMPKQSANILTIAATIRNLSTPCKEILQGSLVGALVSPIA